jgi:hypothetical protein
MNPQSNMAQLLRNAVLYNNARCSMPSDSFPGTAALYTGALPRTHGIWYDDVWDRTLYSAASNCTGPSGFNVLMDETLDANSSELSGGGAFNIQNLPYRKTSWGSCAYLFPHNFLRTKTIFEVVRENGGSTKLTDKHPSYEIFNGPSGTGVYVLLEMRHF